MKIKISEIKELCMKLLSKTNLTKKDAEIILNEYLYGELTGKKSHGLASFPNILNKLKTIKEKWKIIKEDDSYALIDAKGNIGQIVGKFAMNLAIKKAKSKGIALVGMNNMQSYLMPGYYAKMASDNNMIGFVIDNSRSRVAPYGGIEPKLGANPIGLAIPTEKTPFVLDMATSTRAMGEVRLAKKLNTSLPASMALDKKGNPTTDPDKVNALTAFGEYKGYGLCLGIEMLAGSFIRAKMGSNIKDGLDRGYLFIVINPEIFTDINTLKKENEKLLKEIKTSKKAENTSEIRTPGERAQKLMKNNLENEYINIDEKIITQLKSHL